MAVDTPSAVPQLAPVDPIAEEMRRIGSRWGHFLALGIVLIVLGTLMILNSLSATYAITLAAGILMAGAGLVEIVSAFFAGAWRGFFLSLLLGIFYLIAGLMVFRHPVAAVAGITLILALSYMAGGAMRIAFAVTHRTVGTGWVLLNGVITLILGIMIWNQWPWDSDWVIGLFVGIDLIFLGWSWVMLGAAVKPRPAAPA
jgi:uncharacterized membrane protein HdeD (DUF308 family)